MFLSKNKSSQIIKKTTNIICIWSLVFVFLEIGFCYIFNITNYIEGYYLAFLLFSIAFFLNKVNYTLLERIPTN